MPHRPFIRTLRAQWLGQQLRDLREQHGMTLKLVATHLHRDMSALSRYEKAEWPIRRGDVVALLDLYGFHDPAERARLLALAEEVWRTDRWDTDYGDVVDASFIEYPWLEGRAAAVMAYHPILIFGLLQTRAYAAAVINAFADPGTPESTIERYVQFRMDRQEILSRERPPRLTVVLDAAALRQRIGGPGVMPDQLRHLLDLVRRRVVDLRILDVDQPLHGNVFGPFIIFGMPKPYPAVAYAESLAGRLYVEEPKSVRFVQAYDLLLKAALGPRESAELIKAVSEESA